MACQSCQMLSINGIPCHENNCPDRWQDFERECKECGIAFCPEEKYQVCCCEDCASVYRGIPCSCHNYEGIVDDLKIYKTFKRSCTNWKEFGKSRKITVDTDLTFSQAQERCQEFNENRTKAQIRKGTMMELTLQ